LSALNPKAVLFVVLFSATLYIMSVFYEDMPYTFHS